MYSLKTRFMRYKLCAVCILCISALSLSVHAETIEKALPNTIVATADFRPGNPKLPAVLFIHGFLQTPQYQTAVSLIDAISEAHYTVLAPTLSLEIDRRKKSLACEAIHTHTMAGDISEISYWVNWLAAKGYSKIILVGHSYGSLQALAYVSGKPNKAIKKVIATSLVDIEHAVGEQNIHTEINWAKSAVSKGNDAPHEFQISYCKKYVAPPKAFLSYASWLKPHILSALAKAPVPIEIIIGSKDQRMDTHWPEMLKANRAKISLIQGANHFFDADHEFDLTDRVLALLHQ